MTALPQPDWRITAEEIAAIRRDGLRMELIGGKIVMLPFAEARHGRMAGRMQAMVGGWIMQHQAGEAFAAGTGFQIARNPDTVRAPDFTYIQASRVTPQAIGASWGQVLPDLVAEVVSSSDRANESTRRCRCDCGLACDWCGWPGHRDASSRYMNLPRWCRN
jgi:Uma2 family endonuclease